MAEFPEYQVGFLSKSGRVDLLPVRKADVPRCGASLAMELIAVPHLHSIALYHFTIDPEQQPIEQQPGQHTVLFTGTPIAAACRADNIVNGILWCKE